MATFNFNKVNLAAAQIPSAITASQTSITISASESELFPTVPFFATIMPAGGVPNTLNSEIVQVTAVNTASGALTITRAQRGTTAKAQDEGAVIMNGVYIEDLAQAQAVGKSFFPATLSSNVYYIQDARLTTTPENGDSIRVVFGSDWTSGTPKLSLNSGTSYNIYAGNNLTASHGTTNTPAMVKSGIIYELTYYNSAWYILNLTANSSITADNVDWATLGWRPLVCQSGLSGTRVGASFDATGATMLKTTIVAEMSAESWLDFRVYDNNFGNAWSSMWRNMTAGATHGQTTVSTSYGSTASFLNNTPRSVNAIALLTATLARATPTSQWTAQSILSAEAWSTQIAGNEIGSNINQLSMALQSGVNLTGNISIIGFFPS